jgi:hypothetical protein
MQTAAASAPISDITSTNSTSNVSSISTAQAVAIVSPASSSAPADLGSLASSATDAVMSGAPLGISLAALGEIGNYIVTAERLIATMPPYLGSGVDTSA